MGIKTPAQILLPFSFLIEPFQRTLSHGISFGNIAQLRLPRSYRRKGVCLVHLHIAPESIALSRRVALLKQRTVFPVSVIKPDAFCTGGVHRIFVQEQNVDLVYEMLTINSARGANMKECLIGSRARTADKKYIICHLTASYRFFSIGCSQKTKLSQKHHTLKASAARIRTIRSSQYQKPDKGRITFAIWTGGRKYIRQVNADGNIMTQ